MNKLVAEFWLIVGVTWTIGAVVMGMVGYYSFDDPFAQFLISMSSTVGALMAVERRKLAKADKPHKVDYELYDMEQILSDGNRIRAIAEDPDLFDQFVKAYELKIGRGNGKW